MKDFLILKDKQFMIHNVEATKGGGKDNVSRAEVLPFLMMKTPQIFERLIFLLMFKFASRVHNNQLITFYTYFVLFSAEKSRQGKE